MACRFWNRQFREPVFRALSLISYRNEARVLNRLPSLASLIVPNFFRGIRTAYPSRCH